MAPSIDARRPLFSSEPGPTGSGSHSAKTSKSSSSTTTPSSSKPSSIRQASTSTASAMASKAASVASAVSGAGGGEPSTAGNGHTAAAGASAASRHKGSVVDEWPMFSSRGEDYVIGDVIGFGASSVVHQAAFLPLDGRPCAVKVIDLEKFGRDTEALRREAQIMTLSKHPNVLRVRGCWLDGHKLCIATRLMSSGSMLDIMRYSHPDGFDESTIATVLKQALEGLNYLHINGYLHRDFKAANLLVDDDGTVLLGDFGVGVFLEESTQDSSDPSNRRAASSSSSARGLALAGGGQPGPGANMGGRKSFVGTPCWMAPEVVERKHYGAKADIWSFGITALELSSGRAPHSRYAPVKVLMKTLQDEPPTLDREGGAHKYSKAMEDMVRICLQKDPSKRPTAEKLLQHPFFKQAKKKSYLVSAILAGLPPLAQRQTRRRHASIASMRLQDSWDFGSLTGSLASTPAGELFTDPFASFTTSAFPSPTPSIRHKSFSSLMEASPVLDGPVEMDGLDERLGRMLAGCDGAGTPDSADVDGGSRPPTVPRKVRTHSRDGSASSFRTPHHRNSERAPPSALHSSMDHLSSPLPDVVEAGSPVIVPVPSSPSGSAPSSPVALPDKTSAKDEPPAIVLKDDESASVPSTATPSTASTAPGSPALSSPKTGPAPPSSQSSNAADPPPISLPGPVSDIFKGTSATTAGGTIVPSAPVAVPVPSSSGSGSGPSSGSGSDRARRISSPRIQPVAGTSWPREGGVGGLLSRVSSIGRREGASASVGGAGAASVASSTSSAAAAGSASASAAGGGEADRERERGGVRGRISKWVRHAAQS